MTTISTEICCCCGRIDCAFLIQSCSVVDDLQRDVHEAGRLGQALLERYEQYVAESEKDREKLITAMEILEKDKTTLECSNARMIAENRVLLDQLEDLNSSAAESDSHINTLNQTLDSTRQEVQKLASLAHKAALLERELSELESERAKLSLELANNHEEKQFAMQKWRKAEIAVSKLQDQVELIGREAHEEQKRHDEVLSRMKFHHNVKDRLSFNDPSTSKFAKPSEINNAQDGIISNFVRNILEDNSRLQLGIHELKEMLLTSNTDIVNLSAQLDTQHHTRRDFDVSSNSLYNEMSAALSPDDVLDTVPELHVHHHYHQQKYRSRRQRRRNVSKHSIIARISEPYAASTSSEAYSTKGAPSIRTSLPPIVQTTIPTSHCSKCSIYSTASNSLHEPLASSTSPQQYSIFDPIDSIFDTTRATTPATSTPGSPVSAMCSDEGVTSLCEVSNSGLVRLPKQLDYLYTSSHESNMTLDEKLALESCASQQVISASDQTSTAGSDALRSDALRRIRSHSSLLSISGMDIHGPAREQNLPRLKFPSLLKIPVQAPSFSTATVTAATATNLVITRTDQLSSEMAIFHTVRSCLTSRQQGGSSTKRMIDWIYGKRAVAPTLHESVPVHTTNERESIDPANGKPSFRVPGINQSGPIFGLYKPDQAPINTEPLELDVSLLQESLKEALPSATASMNGQI